MQRRVLSAARALGLALALGAVPQLPTAGAFGGLAHAGTGASQCARMLEGAPERIRLLEAVQSCDRADAGCAYFENTAGYGVLTLLCPHPAQVVFADRLRSLRFHDGAWAGDCIGAPWQPGPGLPGCYPARTRVEP